MHRHPNCCNRREWLKTSAAALAALQGFRASAGLAAQEGRSRHRVLVLGIDGLSPVLLRQYVARGRLPNFARLMAAGDFCPLRSSIPPQSPVAWSNFISGMNPGGHGVFDFIHRDPHDLSPYLSTSHTVAASSVLHVGGWEFPLKAGHVECLRHGPVFWQILAQHGVPCTIYKMPTDFPPVPSDARTISGMGTPDLQGAYGVPTYISDVAPPNRETLTDVNLVPVDMSEHRCTVRLLGPANSLDPLHPLLEIPLEIQRDREHPVVRIRVQGQELLLNPGEWSDWVHLRFTMLPYISSVAGICRFLVKEVHPHFKLYVSPINIDPSNPALPISSPPDFCQTLAEEVGLFYTQGIAQDTKSLSMGLLDDQEYLEQAKLVLDERVRVYDHLLKEFSRGLLFFYFSSIDLNSHMFWRSMDPHHPLYSPELGGQYGKVIEDLYAQMDAVVGKALEHVDQDTTLLVLSDHGFAPFYRTFNLNSWLLESGYARLKAGAARGKSRFFAETDWGKTSAYGMGINAVYLNVHNREPQGMLERGKQADQVLERITQDLSDLKDPKTGQSVFAHVYQGKQVYRGPYAEQAPDLILGFNPGFRSSWKTCLGTYEPDVFADNTDKWSGDHCMDVDSIPGVLLSNRKVTQANPALVDLAPTILAEYGIAPLPGMEGKPLFEPRG